MSTRLNNVLEPTKHLSNAFVVHDDEFLKVLGEHPSLEKVIDTNAHEGPVYVRSEDALYFTTVPKTTDIPLLGFKNVNIKRLALNGDTFPLEPPRLSTVRESANMANGMTLDLESNLIICEQSTRSEYGRISKLDLVTGGLETVVDSWRGLRFNSPNDVVVKSDGTVWFTDPSYGYLQNFKPEPMVGNYVYRHDPKRNQTSVVADSFDKPNGLAFSPDEAILYIGDSGAIQAPNTYDVNRPHHVLAFDIKDGRHLVNERLFTVTTPGFPDGIKVDSAGRVYVSASSGILVYNPSGDLIGEILLPDTVNFTFGGQHGNILFITADTAIWAATLRIS